MRCALNGILAAALVVTGSFGMTAPVAAHEEYVREVISAECETPALIKAIKSRFRIQARKIHDRPEWRIEDVTEIHQHRHIPQDVHAQRAVDRRYCHGTAVFNDGTHRSIWYLIEGGMGFAGFGQSWLGSRDKTRKVFANGPAVDNVEFCIEGLDKWNVYNAHCRLLR
ncbi:MAG: hypothetical protein AAFP99_04160 [Pseudomonadota bacterium]